MLDDQEIATAAGRLTDGKLKGADVDSLVSAFRLLLGPLEDSGNYDLTGDLEALDDTGNDRKRAAKMAACHIRLVNEDFGVATLDGELINSDEEQRRLFTLFAFSIMYKIPAELAYQELYAKFAFFRRTSQAIRIDTIR